MTKKTPPPSAPSNEDSPVGPAVHIDRLSTRPQHAPEPRSPSSWRMALKDNGNYLLTDPSGAVSLELYEPLHPDEIDNIALLVTQVSQSGVDQGKNMERQRLKEIVARL